MNPMVFGALIALLSVAAVLMILAGVIPIPPSL